MADLSDMLGDVYGDDANGEPHAPEAPPQHRDGTGTTPVATGRSGTAAEDTNRARPAPEATNRAPAWADESVLDAAFANWTPGPPLDAPAAERDVFAPHVDPASAPPLPDDLAAALSAALVGAPPADVAFIATPAAATPGTDVEQTTPASTSDPVDSPLGEGGSWAEPAASHRAHTDYDDPFSASMPLVGRLPWQRGDDDILPRRSSSSRRGRGGLAFRRK